jgi:heme/copper-type cytochrome/quinol oxidase subunit 2
MSQPKSPSVWHYKPWWCQPWSILLTGITLISGSWLIFKIIWLTIIIAIPVLTWMIFFVIIYPKLALEAEMPNITDQQQS